MTATGPLHFVDHIDVEQYLRGMGEVRNPSWPKASLMTQAIAARTYALRSVGGELCDYDRCQVYLGANAEYGAMDKAVSALKEEFSSLRTGRASASLLDQVHVDAYGSTMPIKPIAYDRAKSPVNTTERNR